MGQGSSDIVMGLGVATKMFATLPRNGNKKRGIGGKQSVVCSVS